MFRVRWGPEIIDEISRVYDGLDDESRERLLAALEVLDSQLQNDPISLGESRASPLVRVAIEGPITVIFRVDDVHRFVRVTGVSYFQRKK